MWRDQWHEWNVDPMLSTIVHPVEDLQGCVIRILLFTLACRRAYLLAMPICSWFLGPWQTKNNKWVINQNKEGIVKGKRCTFRTWSIKPVCIFVQVRCRIVLIPVFWIQLASSRLRSFVEPPAPHVTLIASGCKADKREIRDMRFSKPCRRLD